MAPVPHFCQIDASANFPNGTGAGAIGTGAKF